MASRPLSWRALALLWMALGCDAPQAEPAEPADPAEPSSASEPARPPAPKPVRVAPSCKLVDPPPGFVDVRTRIPSAIVAAGYHGSDNFTGAPLPGYEAPGAWLTVEAADALARAAQRLEADGLRL